MAVAVTGLPYGANEAYAYESDGEVVIADERGPLFKLTPDNARALATELESVAGHADVVHRST